MIAGMTEPKPLAKSLHTVTVLVCVAQDIYDNTFGETTPEASLQAALKLLGLADKPDTYGLAAAALKQLEK